MSRPRKYNYERIRVLYESGATIREIALLEQCDRKTVREAIACKPKPRKADTKQLSLLLTVRQYVKLCEIADKHEVSIGKVIRQYIEKGISDDRAA